MNKNVWGHRGCRGAGNPPENSLSAFQFAIEAGAGGIELDVFLTADGVPIVFHDDTLDRMVGVTGAVSSLTLAEIQKFYLLTADGRASRATIPTLAEVLDLVDRYRKNEPVLVVNIELKDSQSVEKVQELIRMRLEQRWLAENFLVSSFEMSALRHFKSLMPSIPLGTLFECEADELAAKIAEISDIKPSTINIPSTALTPSAFERIAAAGATPVVWTPNEVNPNKLPAVERHNLIKTLRERHFVTITDYPRELLQWLKPSRTKATVTGVLAACLAFSQQDMMFQPTESGLESMRSPSEYPELSQFGFYEVELKAEDGISFLIWERLGSLDRPHYLLFHGNRAHWGDTGGGDDVTRDRRARLKFIHELAASGAGVTAVTLRGFGKSSALPNERGFLLDLKAVTEHLSVHGFDHQKLVVAGESLGTWAATQTAVYLTQGKTPPAVLSLQNPFTSAAEVGAVVVSQFPIIRSLHVGLSASSLDRHVLTSHFYTAKLITQISPKTLLHIATSGKDELVHPSHSDRLSEIANRKNLRVVRDLFPNARHSTIPPIEYAQRLIALGGQSCHTASDVSQLWDDSLRATGRVDHLPYL